MRSGGLDRDDRLPLGGEPSPDLCPDLRLALLPGLDRRRKIGASRPHLGHGRVGRRSPFSSSQIGVNRLAVATARPGGQDEATGASGKLTPHGESRCCRSRSSRRPASRRHCTCNHTYCRSAGRAGASSARVWPACSGRRRGSTPPTRQSCLPFAHSRPGGRCEGVVQIGGVIAFRIPLKRCAGTCP